MKCKKKIINFTLALLTASLIQMESPALFALEDQVSFESEQWHTDDDDFTGWVLENGSVSGSGISGKRIWKELTNTNDFTATLVLQVEASSRCFVKALGTEFEVNPQGGNGNQVFLKYYNGSDWVNLDWLDAKDCKVSVTISRSEGKDVTYSFKGEGNDTPKEVTIPARESDAKGVEFKLEGTGKCLSLTMNCKASTSDVWHTDDDDFTGWVLENGSVSGSGISGKRIWKELTNTNDFTATLVLQVEASSRCFVKALGTEFEVNPQGGNGNQVFLKYYNGSDWVNLDWLDAKDCKVSVTISRSEGKDVTYSFKGEGNDTPKEVTIPARESDAKGVEFKLEGTGKCLSLTMNCKPSEGGKDEPIEDPDRPKTPLEVAGWTNVDKGYDFTGWSIDENGNISGTNGAIYRIKKDLITNQNDFTVTANFKMDDESSIFFKVVSVEFELDARHSSSEQVYVKGIPNNDWLDAKGFAGSIKISRTDGGDINFEVTGEGNDKVMSGSRPASKATTAFEFGFYAGKGTLSNLNVVCKDGPVVNPDPTPDTPKDSPLKEDGWNVEAEGEATLVEGDFSGWEIVDGKINSIKGKWMDMENIVLSKKLLTDINNFSLQLVVDTDFFSSPCIQILGVRLELDGNHGDGNQVFVKKDSVGAGGEDSWFMCKDDIVYVNLSRKNGGKLQIVLWGEGNVNSLELSYDVAEETDIVKLIVFRGEAKFMDITVGSPDKEPIKPDLSGIDNPDPTPTPDPDPTPTPDPKPEKKGCKGSVATGFALVGALYALIALKRRKTK